MSRCCAANRSDASAAAPLGRVVATERRPNTPHEFHFWTSLDSPVGVGTIVRVEGKYTINGQITRVYGVVVEGFSYSDLQSPLHDVLGHVDPRAVPMVTQEVLGHDDAAGHSASLTQAAILQR